MAIIAKFPDGVSEITVNGLHQWDYGQQLQIESSDLPAMIEVHFAYAKMKEAIVRTCAGLNGVATVTIPDHCLEQSAQITAWVYLIGETSGVTVKTIKLNVIPRTRPAQCEDIPEADYNKYDALVGEINAQINALKTGNVTVNRALNANQAANATMADNAKKATAADQAAKAEIADFASNDISKGTIEARLSSLGFKQGAFEIVGGFGSRVTIVTNKITKIGKCAIASFEAQFIGIPAQYLELKIPDEFKPARDTQILLEKEDTDVEDGRLASFNTIRAGGYISVSLGFTDYNSGWVRFYNVGWELADSAVYPTISFTVYGKTCYAEKGMTWREYIGSPYNTGEPNIYLFNDDDQWVRAETEDVPGETFYIVDVYGSGAHPDDPIESGYAYGLGL